MYVDVIKILFPVVFFWAVSVYVFAENALLLSGQSLSVNVCPSDKT